MLANDDGQSVWIRKTNSKSTQCLNDFTMERLRYHQVGENFCDWQKNAVRKEAWRNTPLTHVKLEKKARNERALRASSINMSPFTLDV